MIELRFSQHKFQESIRMRNILSYFVTEDTCDNLNINTTNDEVIITLKGNERWDIIKESIDLKVLREHDDLLDFICLNEISSSCPIDYDNPKGMEIAIFLTFSDFPSICLKMKPPTSFLSDLERINNLVKIIKKFEETHHPGQIQLILSKHEARFSILLEEDVLDDMQQIVLFSGLKGNTDKIKEDVEKMMIKSINENRPIDFRHYIKSITNEHTNS